MMQAGLVAKREQYLTVGGVLGALATVVLDKAACLRRGHDPLWTGDGVLCTRCLRTLSR